MDRQKELLLKIENLEDDYRRKHKQLDEMIDAVNREKLVFNRELEYLYEQMSYLFNKRGYNDSQEVQPVYHMIESAQEETEWIVKRALRKLEEEQEECQFAYKKQIILYEEEYHRLKKERSFNMLDGLEEDLLEICKNLEKV